MSTSMVAYPAVIHDNTSAEFENEYDGTVLDEGKDVKIFDDGADDESGWFNWMKWRPVSNKTLRESENTILSSTLLTAYTSYYVNIGCVVGKKDSRIWTLSLNPESTEVPLVLVHGFAAGVGFWCLNLDSLAAERPVYAIDLLGFGRSSRPTFSDNPETAEFEFAESIDAWRRAMKLEKIILLGHSLGGYLSTSVAIRYPNTIEHLILADPWGFNDRPLEIRRNGKEVSVFIRMLLRLVEPMNPLSTIRFVGPWGPNLIRFVRSDIIARFEPYVKDAHNTVANYLYQCNARKPSGESAFHAMMNTFFWAKKPMHHRFHHLDEKLPITLIFGARSWVEELPTEKVKEHRGCGGYVKSYVIDATHHVYADQKDEFNQIVDDACRKLKRQF